MSSIIFKSAARRVRTGRLFGTRKPHCRSDHFYAFTLSYTHRCLIGVVRQERRECKGGLVGGRDDGWAGKKVGEWKVFRREKHSSILRAVNRVDSSGLFACNNNNLQDHDHNRSNNNHTLFSLQCDGHPSIDNIRIKYENKCRKT